MPSQRPYGSAAIRSASAGGVGCEPAGPVILRAGGVLGVPVHGVPRGIPPQPSPRLSMIAERPGRVSARAESGIARVAGNPRRSAAHLNRVAHTRQEARR